MCCMHWNQAACMCCVGAAGRAPRNHTLLRVVAAALILRDLALLAGCTHSRCLSSASFSDPPMGARHGQGGPRHHRGIVPPSASACSTPRGPLGVRAAQSGSCRPQPSHSSSSAHPVASTPMGSSITAASGRLSSTHDSAEAALVSPKGPSRCALRPCTRWPLGRWDQGIWTSWGW